MGAGKFAMYALECQGQGAKATAFKRFLDSQKQTWHTTAMPSTDKTVLTNHFAF